MRQLFQYIILMSMIIAVAAIIGCTPSAETVVEGNRHIESTTVGRLANAKGGDGRIFFVLHDTDTGGGLSGSD